MSPRVFASQVGISSVIGCTYYRQTRKDSSALLGDTYGALLLDVLNQYE